MPISILIFSGCCTFYLTCLTALDDIKLLNTSPSIYSPANYINKFKQSDCSRPNGRPNGRRSGLPSGRAVCRPSADLPNTLFNSSTPTALFSDFHSLKNRHTHATRSVTHALSHAPTCTSYPLGIDTCKQGKSEQS
jgi:hypothetical protein